MTDRVLLRGGHVLTMDPALGDLRPGDVLVSGDRIEAVGPRIGADTSNVDHVLVAGAFRKRDGRLLADIARVRSLAEAARDAVLARAGKRDLVA